MAWQQRKASGLYHLSIDKFLSRNRNKVWILTHQRAVKEESKVANRYYVDRQACSLLQYFKDIASILGKQFKFN